MANTPIIYLLIINNAFIVNTYNTKNVDWFFVCVFVQKKSFEKVFYLKWTVIVDGKGNLKCMLATESVQIFMS